MSWMWDGKQEVGVAQMESWEWDGFERVGSLDGLKGLVGRWLSYSGGRTGT